MKIGFFGHSISSWIGDPRSFIDQVRDGLNAKIVNVGVPQGSQERILFDLKKTKEIDVAIIFHSRANYIFLPKCERDIAINVIPENKAKILWSEDKKEPISDIEFEREFFTYGKIKEVFKDTETFVQTLTLYKEFLYHPDLQMNRFQGSLILIDAFCRTKVPRTIHVGVDKLLPPWFKFSSGENHQDLVSIMLDQFALGLDNNLSLEGNKIMAEAIINKIQK